MELDRGIASGDARRMQNRLKEIREALGMSQKDVADLVRPRTTPQQIGRLEKNQRSLRPEWVERLAPALRCDPSELLYGPREKRKTVPLVGYAGAGERYYPDPMAGPWIGFDEVDAPPFDANVVAVRVRGDSMKPTYRDGDLLYFERIDGHSPNDFVGRDCIVQVRGGPTYLKVLEHGAEPHRYRLESYNKESADIDGVDVEWAARIVWVKKA